MSEKWGCCVVGVLLAMGCSGDPAATGDAAVDAGGALDGAVDAEVADGGEAADPCEDDPCDNGSCRAETDGTFVCDCDDGFAGERCDEAIDCGDPGPVSDPLSVDLSEGTGYGAIATYACATGYALVGDEMRTCGASGWSGSEPSCEATVACTADSCSGHGECAVVDGVIACTCGAGWTGATCDARIDCGALTPTDPNLFVDYTPNGDAESQGEGAVAAYSCATGYERSGAPGMRTCSHDGVWTPPGEPTCQLVDCGPPPTGGELSVVLETGTTTFGSDATYTCASGYRLTGDAASTCAADGTWSGSRTCDRIVCPAYTPVSGDLTVDNPGDTDFGDVAMLSCTGGLVLSGGTAIRCDADASGTGTWMGTEPTCEAPPMGCETDTCNGHGTCIESGGVFDRCNCVDGWTGSFCNIPVDCGVISPSGASLSVGYTPNGVGENTGFGATATYSCAAGTTLTGTPTSRSCAADGTWTPSGEPTCSVVDCGAPASADPNGDVSYSTTTYLGVATYSCDPGYTASGPTTVTCLASGAWSGAAPSCSIVSCGAPPSTNGSGSSLDGSSGTTYGATASYVCAAGYTGAGGDLTCDATGTWSGSALACTPVDCGAPTSPTHGSASYTTTTFGSSTSYACDAGYTPSGATMATCLASGSWSAPPPTCVAPTCTLTYALNDSSFHIRDTAFGAGNADIQGDGTDTGSLHGFVTIRVPSSAGSPSSGTAAVMEYEIVQDFTVSDVVTDVTASAGDGTSAVASGTFTTGAPHRLVFSPCALPAGTDVDEPDHSDPVSYTPSDVGTGSGCLAPYRSVGTVTCNAGSFICGLGNLSVGANSQNETWEQSLNEITLASDYSSLTMSTTGSYARSFSGAGAMAIPNLTPSTTWMHWAGALISMTCE